jgi:hypothetical protein
MLVYKPYTEYNLFKYLLENRISAIGTVAKGRRLLPKDITKKTWPKTKDDRHKGKWLIAKYRENDDTIYK